MSDTATLTRLPGALRTASSTFLAGRSFGMKFFPDLPGRQRRCSRSRDCNPGKSARDGTMALDDRSLHRLRITTFARARRAASRGAAVRVRGLVRQVAAVVAGDDRLRPRG